MSASPAEIPGSGGATAPSQLFVINLCASTSPVALSHPSSPELKRYTFFVSRQREEGRERFRLHMGYFASQEEAEQLLELVRDIYPAAWAGPAPTSGAPRRRTVTARPVQAASPPEEVLEAMSNVRDVLAQLSETAAPRQQPVPPPQPAPRVQQAPHAATPELSERQVLEALEITAPTPAVGPAVASDAVRLVTPEDTQVLADIRRDMQSNAPPCFAVQLVWSMSPINMANLQHLAIFDAYTLYNVEGSRQGRKWYGLRLGFFSDQAAAAEVAGYVRSDYRAVAIVPVATRERDSAGGGDVSKKAKSSKPPGSVPRKPDTGLPRKEDDLQGFELLPDDRPPPVKLDLDDAPAAAVKHEVPVAKPAVRPVTKAAGKPAGKRVVARKRPVAPIGKAAPGAPTPLESTLEILGASTLTTVDEGRTIINDSAVREPVDRKSSGGNRFARLLGRLGRS